MHQLLNISASTKQTESELERSSIAESSKDFMIGVVPMPLQSFVLSVNRIGKRTVPCGKPVQIKQKDESTAW